MREVEGAVEVDQVQKAGAIIDPASGHLFRVVAVDSLPVGFASHQADAASTANIYGRYDQRGGFPP